MPPFINAASRGAGAAPRAARCRAARHDAARRGAMPHGTAQRGAARRGRMRGVAAEPITDRALNRATLARQLLLVRERMPVAEAVARIGPLQAQEPKPPFVALASRLDGFEPAELVEALRSGEVVRAVWIRATLHVLTAADHRALRATIQAPLSAAAARVADARGVTVDPADLAAAARDELAGGPLDFDALRQRLTAAFPGSEERALGYLARLHVPLTVEPTDDRWGFARGGRFAAAEADGEARPGLLARRYLAAFGPASAADLKAFTGLAGTREVLDGMELVTFEAGRRTLYDLPDAPRPGEDAEAPPRLLAPFDSLLLAHQDRARLVGDAHKPALVTKNLRIPATFLVDGMVAGTWTQTRGKLDLQPFGKLSARDRRALEHEAERLPR
jgi:hypothetical protein